MMGASASSLVGGTASTVSIVLDGAPRLMVRLRTLLSSFSSVLLLASSANCSNFCRSLMLSICSPSLDFGGAGRTVALRPGVFSSSSGSFSGRYCLRRVLPRRAMDACLLAKLIGDCDAASVEGEVAVEAVLDGETTPKGEKPEVGLVGEAEVSEGLAPSLTAREACSWRNWRKCEGEISG